MPLLSDERIEERLVRLEGWRRRGEAIEREFDRGDFAGSIEFVNGIAPIAEEMNHHPDLAVSWSKVTVSLSTHSEGGLTESDFQLAEKIEALA